MLRTVSFLPIVLFALLWLPCQAGALEVATGKIARGIEQREPVGVAESFPAEVGRLYCYIRVIGAEVETTITHVWLHDGKEMARVELPVRSADWRTWSSKTILPAWTGSWRVDVLDAEGHLLQQLPFTVGGAM